MTTDLEMTKMNVDSDSISKGDDPLKQPIDWSFQHELRNICSAMQNAIDVIRLDKDLSKDSREMLAVLDRQLLRLASTFGCLSDQTIERDGSATTIEPMLAERTENQSLSRKLEILVVDDTRLVAFTLQKLLEKLGQSVQLFSDGVSAIESMRQKMPDIVFSDIGMEAMDGYELAKRIRAMPNGCDVWLVALTGCSSPGSEGNSIEAGFNEHFEKPLAYETLVGILMHVIANY